MRIGQNPGKENSALEMTTYHRIIIPVYIPNFEGYFQDAEKIFNICITSLLKSLHSGCAISVINNACCDTITAKLRLLKDEGKIDRLIDANKNKGKIDPLISEMRSSYEPLITVADADVLFKSNWLIQVEKLFKAIPECGMVGHLPDPKKFKGFNATTLLSTLGKAKHEMVDYKDELVRFAQSIGEPEESYVETEIKVFEKNGVKSVIGAHHFSTTLRKEYLEMVPGHPSLKKITGNSESHYIDKPVDKIGFLRLSTRYPVVYHMGNVFESWMDSELNNQKEMDTNEFEFSTPESAKRTAIGKLPYKIRTILETLLFRTPVYKLVQKVFY